MPPPNGAHAVPFQCAMSFAGTPALANEHERGLALELEVFEAAFATDDAAIGVESFRTNGPGKATFTGK